MYEIFCGSPETMKHYAEKGVRAINPKTHKWQIIDKNACYEIRENAYKWGVGAVLLCDKDLRAIAKEKGLIL